MDEAIYQAKQQSGKDFLAFQGKLTLNGMVAGLTGGLGNVAVEATAGTRIGNVLEYALTTRTGTAATGAVVNAGAQAAKNDGHINLVEVGTSAASGYLGLGRGFWWNTALGAGAGVVNTEYGNLANGTDDNVWLGGATGGMTTGAGYGVGGLATNRLSQGQPGALGPVIWGNFISSVASEFINYTIEQAESHNNNAKKDMGKDTK
jgi:filamentous hemagglutinin